MRETTAVEKIVLAGRSSRNDTVTTPSDPPFSSLQCYFANAVLASARGSFLRVTSPGIARPRKLLCVPRFAISYCRSGLVIARRDHTFAMPLSATGLEGTHSSPQSNYPGLEDRMTPELICGGETVHGASHPIQTQLVSDRILHTRYRYGIAGQQQHSDFTRRIT